MISDFFSTTSPSSSPSSTCSEAAKWQRELEAKLSTSNQMPARLVFVGDGRVGTSSIIRRFTANRFSEHYRPEQAKVMRHSKTMFSTKLEHDVSVQYWDVEGGDMQTGMFCAAKAHAVAVVYDITNRTSFERAQTLLDGINPLASALLVANKSDLDKHLRKVSYKEGKLLAKIHRVQFLETSAKTDSYIEEVFKLMLASVPEEYLRSKESASTKAERRWHVSTSVVLCAVCTKKVHSQGKDRSDSNHSSASNGSNYSNRALENAREQSQAKSKQRGTSKT